MPDPISKQAIQRALVTDSSPQPLLIVSRDPLLAQMLVLEALEQWTDQAVENYWPLQMVMGEGDGESSVSVRSVLAELSLRHQGRKALMLRLGGTGAEVQNALLKTFEECPADLCLVGLTDSPAGVLKTLRSRCQEIRLAKLDAQELAYAAQQIGISANDQQIGWADGSLTRLVWAVDNPDTLRACQDMDGSGLLVQLKQSQAPGAWIENVLDQLRRQGAGGAAAAQQMLTRGSKPESVLARALLG